MTNAQKEARAIAERLERAVKRAEEHAGIMPARQAVKLHPNDWHAVCDLAREAATALAAKDAERDGWKKTATEYATELQAARHQLAEANKAMEEEKAAKCSAWGEWERAQQERERSK